MEQADVSTVAHLVPTDVTASSGLRARPGRALAAVALLLVLAAAGRSTFRLARMVVETPRLPQWDMAHRGVVGLRLAEALRHGDAAGFLYEINDSSVWPPLFPLLEAPFFLTFGYEYRVPRLLACALFFLSVPAIFWAGCRLGGEHGLLAGLLAAGFLAASPELHLYATLNMLEVPGALLLILALGAYCRALGSSDPGRWRLAWSLATALFFLKFNYGLMWLGPLLALEAWPARGALRAAIGSAWPRLRRVDWRRPWPAFVLLYAAFICGILLAGGWETEIAGEKLRIQSLGSPLYVLYLAATLRYLARPRSSLLRFRGWLAGLEPRRRQLALWVALPIGVWMLLPPHARDFFHFVENRSSDLGFLSFRSLAFYPRCWVHEYSSSSAVGAAVLVLAFLPCLVLPRLDPRLRVLATALLFAAGALVLHPYKLPRFAFTAAPLVWLSAASVVARGLVAASRRWAGRSSPLVALAVAFAVAAASAAGGAVPRSLRGGFVYHTVSPAVEELLDDVFFVVHREESTVILGTWNRLSPWLVEWHGRRRFPELDPARLPAAGRRIEGLHGETLCEDLSAGAVIVLEPLTAGLSRPVRREYAEEIAPLAGVYSAIAGAACYRLVVEKTYRGAGYRARLYRRR